MLSHPMQTIKPTPTGSFQFLLPNPSLDEKAMGYLLPCAVFALTFRSGHLTPNQRSVLHGP
jgi:hypothetical protein